MVSVYPSMKEVIILRIQYNHRAWRVCAVFSEHRFTADFTLTSFYSCLDSEMMNDVG